MLRVSRSSSYNDLPRPHRRVLDLFCAHVGNDLNECAGSSGSFHREFALNSLKFGMEKMVATWGFGAEPLPGDLHCFAVEHHQ